MLGLANPPVLALAVTLFGSSFVDMLSLFQADEQTEAIVMIGEIGGTAEEEAAVYIKQHVTKPVVAYIAG